MDCSYIEEESIHISVPYTSEPRWSCNITSESIDEGEHQISRPFELNILDESESHHHFIPCWRINPSKNLGNHSRPKTSIVSIPLKMHLLDESSFIEEEDNDSIVFNSIYQIYGKTGIFLCSNCKWELPLGTKFLEEFLCNPDKTVELLSEHKELIREELTVLNKIIIDICIEFLRKKKSKELQEWINIAKEFYFAMKSPIETNFCQNGILHFNSKEEYFEYFKKIEEEIE